MRRTSIILILICITALFATCNDTEQTDQKKEETVIPVEVADIAIGDFKVKKSVYGSTAPSKQSPVMLQEAGEIKEIEVKNGDQVDEDEYLATVKTPMGEREINAPSDG